MKKQGNRKWKNSIVKGVGAFGDGLNQKICLLIMYQPKARKRGKGEEAK